MARANSRDLNKKEDRGGLIVKFSWSGISTAIEKPYCAFFKALSNETYTDMRHSMVATNNHKWYV
jgi:hypothetical protein